MLRVKNLLLMHHRCKSRKIRWSELSRKKTNKIRALESFDDFYLSVYGIRWKNMRAALLTEHKYVALVNNFGDTERTCSKLEIDGAINIKSVYTCAKERLCNVHESSTKETKISTLGMDNKMEQLIKKSELQEKTSLYPENTSDRSPDNIQFGNNQRHEDLEASRQQVDPRKSLEQALEEDKYIAHDRIVKPEFGTGALQQFVPATKIKGMEDWVPESAHFQYYTDTPDFPIQIEVETQFNFPENLLLYTYEIGNCSLFQPPKECMTGVLSHFIMDGGSILPPLMLDVKYGERVLDACAAPGGKSLIMLQTLHPAQVVCNDIQESRTNRIRKVMKDYLFDFKKNWQDKRVKITQSDARFINEYNSYDKILVDVPCTTDRHSVMVNDNNIFKVTRVKERIRIPELQSAILTNCLRLLRPGGSLVYSTCTLSPVQNDGVVQMALHKAFQEYGITTTIKDLTPIMQYFSDIFKFEHPKGLKYGQMVIPYLPANFGPMYFSKITRDT